LHTAVQQQLPWRTAAAALWHHVNYPVTCLSLHASQHTLSCRRQLALTSQQCARSCIRMPRSVHVHLARQDGGMHRALFHLAVSFGVLLAMRKLPYACMLLSSLQDQLALQAGCSFNGLSGWCFHGAMPYAMKWHSCRLHCLISPCLAVSLLLLRTSGVWLRFSYCNCYHVVLLLPALRCCVSAFDLCCMLSVTERFAAVLLLPLSSLRPTVSLSTELHLFHVWSSLQDYNEATG
jgi:hypothetical protein